MENNFQIRKMHEDYYKDNVDTFKEKKKVFYVWKRPKVRKAHKNYYNYSKSKTSEITAGNNNLKTFTKKSLSKSESCERIELFHKLCRKRLTFICVMCNRCLYQKSVRKFDRNNYSDLDFERFSEISNNGIYLFDLPWAF